MIENHNDTDILTSLRTLMEANNTIALKKFIMDIHPVDIAKTIKDLSLEEALIIIKCLDNKVTSTILIELDKSLGEKILASLSDKEIAEQLVEMPTDDAADITLLLGKERLTNIIPLIKDKKHANDIIELLRFDEDTAGGLMAKELVSVRQEWDIITSLQKIKKQAENVYKIHSIYVIDKDGLLKGRVSIKDILTKPDNILIENIYISDIEKVSVNDKAEEIADIMGRYNLESLPVIDELGRLVGRITIDDIIDVIKEEADKDYQMAAGISVEIEHNTGLRKTIRARLPWLLVGTGGGLLAAYIIEGFTTIIHNYPILLIFIPLLQATGGNVGVQASAIVVQAIARNELKEKIFRTLSEEFLLGIINGVAISLIAMSVSFAFFDMAEKEILVIGLTMITVIVNAGLIGTFIPYILNKINIDPALATGPFITTGADIIGVLIYFFIAKALLIA